MGQAAGGCHSPVSLHQCPTVERLCFSGGFGWGGAFGIHTQKQQLHMQGR